MRFGGVSLFRRGQADPRNRALASKTLASVDPSVVERQFFWHSVPSTRLVKMTVSRRVVLLLLALLGIAGGLRRRPQRALLSVTRGSGADADDEPRPQALRALTVPRGGNDDEDEPYDDVDDEPDDDDDDEARAAEGGTKMDAAGVRGRAARTASSRGARLRESLGADARRRTL